MSGRVGILEAVTEIVEDGPDDGADGAEGLLENPLEKRGGGE